MLIDRAIYALPDGTLVRCVRVMPAGWWQLETLDGWPLYGLFRFGVCRFDYDAENDGFRILPTDLTVGDLRPIPEDDMAI